jgi:hypothetical protein
VPDGLLALPQHPRRRLLLHRRPHAHGTAVVPLLSVFLSLRRTGHLRKAEIRPLLMYGMTLDAAPSHAVCEDRRAWLYNHAHHTLPSGRDSHTTRRLAQDSSTPDPTCSCLATCDSWGGRHCRAPRHRARTAARGCSRPATGTSPRAARRSKSSPREGESSISSTPSSCPRPPTMILQRGSVGDSFVKSHN